MADPAALVTTSTTGAVRTITLTRPEKKNALTLAMYVRLTELFHEASADPGVRVVILTGAGSAFTAGNDLADFMGAPAFDAGTPVLRFLATLVDFEKPLVAAVNGAAVGIGTTALLHCDLAYAASSARFQLPFVNLGLVPEAASSVLLPALAGHVRAAELLLFGEPFDAATALRMGLVNEVLPDAELLPRVQARCAGLAERPPEAVRETKRLLRAPQRAAIHEAIAREAGVFQQRLGSPEVAEAISAFFEKRRPDFSRQG